MRLHGYCEKCHRVRRVRVSGHGMATLAAGRAAVGICDDCERREDEARTARFNEARR